MLCNLRQRGGLGELGVSGGGGVGVFLGGPSQYEEC